MKTIDFSYFIERYISDEMTEAELIWFQKELEGNDDLSEEVALRRKADMILKSQDKIQLRNKLSDIERKRKEKEKENMPVRSPKRRITLKHAALITFFVMAGSMLLFTDKSLSADEIISRYYTPYEGITGMRSGNTVVNTDYITALDYYNIRDYRNAAHYFNKVVSNDPRYIESTMYYGVSNYEIKNFPEAEQSFRKVIGNNENLYLDDAQWYLALCYIQTGELVSALSQLELIKKSESIYSRDAKKILRKIKK